MYHLNHRALPVDVKLVSILGWRSVDSEISRLLRTTWYCWTPYRAFFVTDSDFLHHEDEMHGIVTILADGPQVATLVCSGDGDFVLPIHENVATQGVRAIRHLGREVIF